LVFCRFYTQKFFKSLLSGFQSGWHTLFFFFNQRQHKTCRFSGFKKLDVLFLFFLSSVLCFLFYSTSFAASVTLAWDANQEEDVVGYNVYYGTSSHHYTNMDNAGNNTSYTITNLEPGRTYYIAATAYDFSGNESGFSQEIPYTVPFVDSDGDGVADEQDAFPLDPNESVDTDGDGYGNNSDNDDDDDGMPDAWEIVNNLDPLVNDANGDPDGDRVSNLEEYNAGTGPYTYEDLSVPEAPVILTPLDNETVSLSPELTTDEFYDPDTGDFHAESRWQIFRASDNFCVLDITSPSSLTSLQIPKLILEEDLDYNWRVRFINNHKADSDWSDIGSFTTEITGHDFNSNGIQDHQEVDAFVDLDEDGTPDMDQDDIRCVNVQDSSAQIGVGLKGSETVQEISSIESENPNETDAEIATDGKPISMPFGLLNFKLIVDQPGDEAVVTIYLSEPAPFGTVWYKYDSVNKIWQDYSEYIEFNDDRKSINLTLIDGGFGDADGIENSIIVDPLTLGAPPATAAAISPAASDGGSGSSSGCFISTANHSLTAKEPIDIWKKIRGIELAMMFLVPFLILYLRNIAKRR